MERRRIGIIGGMGPMATVDLMRDITRLTAAATDQEHLPLLVDSTPSIPDRTAAILHEGEDPLPALIDSAKRLESMGAELLGMACNTAHYFYEGIQASVRIPLVHMIRETALEAGQRGFETVGLLATAGACRSGVFTQAFREAGVRLILPAEDRQDQLMELIYQGVKKGDPHYPPDNLFRLLDELQVAGAEAMVLGCTELPLAFRQYAVPEDRHPFLNPTEILARRLITLAGGTVANRPI